MAQQTINNVEMRVTDHGVMGMAYGAVNLTMEQFNKVLSYLRCRYRSVQPHWTSDYTYMKFSGYFLCHD